MEVEGGREENNGWSVRKGIGEKSWREVKEDGGRGRQGRKQWLEREEGNRGEKLAGS
jgi:hypothetical protein